MMPGLRIWAMMMTLTPNHNRLTSLNYLSARSLMEMMMIGMFITLELDELMTAYFTLVFTVMNTSLNRLEI